MAMVVTAAQWRRVVGDQCGGEEEEEESCFPKESFPTLSFPHRPGRRLKRRVTCYVVCSILDCNYGFLARPLPLALTTRRLGCRDTFVVIELRCLRG